MDTLTAVQIIEGVFEQDDESVIIEAWQSLIDSGVVWSLQGSYGRTATHLINTEQCRAA